MIRCWEKTKGIRGFLLWTATVAAATWAVFTYMLDANRIASFEAKSQAFSARADQYAAKADVLERENLSLRAENQQMRGWLESEPKSFPVLSKRIAELQKEISDLKTNCVASSQDTPSESSTKQIDSQSKYSNVVNFKKGEAIADPNTKVIVGVSEISSAGLVSGTITLPDGKTQKFDRVRPGQAWDYSKGNEKFQTILKRADWIDNGVTVETRRVK